MGTETPVLPNCLCGIFCFCPAAILPTIKPATPPSRFRLVHPAIVGHLLAVVKLALLRK
jgi:hypothetical protein